MPPRVVVVGGGLIGLGTAYALVRAPEAFAVTVLEKEAGPGQHQSSHNSGVLHAGLYYAPGSSKARLAVRGIRSMTAFCEEHHIAHEICGKLVVAVDDSEVPRLKILFDRGLANGLRGLRWLGAAEAHEIEPNVRCVAAVAVPEEGIVDYARVVAALSAQIVAHGGQLQTSSEVRALQRRSDGWLVRTDRSELRADFIVNCGGLQSDRIAQLAGERTDCRIVPFRGDYFVLRPERQSLVRHLVYPVPDPAFPFLGVHFTRMISGGVECGPNAVLALAREGYGKTAFRLRDAVESLSYRGLWSFVRQYPQITWFELARSLSKSLFTKSLQRLVPDVVEGDLRPGPAGVRAQAMMADGTLVQDFLFVERRDALHVLNAPSPGATASLAIGEEIAAKVRKAISHWGGRVPVA